MPLIRCKECGKDVSSLASACPTCGCPVSASLKAGTQANPTSPQKQPTQPRYDPQYTRTTEDNSFFKSNGFKIVVGVAVITILALFSITSLKHDKRVEEYQVETASESPNGTSTPAPTTKPVAMEPSNESGIEYFNYEIIDGVLRLDDYVGNNDILTINSSYTLEGSEYPVDLSSFRVSANSVKTLIIGEGITAINNAIFNSCEVTNLYIPTTLSLLYDDTLAYFSEDACVEIYYGGTEEAWNNILTKYDPASVGEALDNEDYEDAGASIAYKINKWVGHEYDPTNFTFHFESEPANMY